jgi:predicted NBD/HSP70 family sugar kinase
MQFQHDRLGLASPFPVLKNDISRSRPKSTSVCDVEKAKFLGFWHDLDMAGTCAKVAQGLLLWGEHLRRGEMKKEDFFQGAVAPTQKGFDNTRNSLGAVGKRYFEKDGLKFGPGAGFVVGMSVGPSKVRALVLDANGEQRANFTSPTPIEGLRHLPPNELLSHLKTALTSVVEPVRGDHRALIDGRWPLLGVSIAWGGPVNREKMPMGRTLSDPGWHVGTHSLVRLPAAAFRLPEDRLHAQNDAQATAIAVAFDQTQQLDYVNWTHPKLNITLRIAGGVGSGIIVVERPPKPREPAFEHHRSGFPTSILLGGADLCSGEIGHAPIELGLIDSLNNRDLGEKAKATDWDLGEITPAACSCDLSKPGDHIEAYTSIPALARRFPDRPGSPLDVIEDILRRPDQPAHAQALADIGEILGRSMRGPIAILDPATIALTGTLAVPSVQTAFELAIGNARPFGGPPTVYANPDNFAAARGAALAVMRRLVYRRFTALLGHARNTQIDAAVEANPYWMDVPPWV